MPQPARLLLSALLFVAAGSATAAPTAALRLLQSGDVFESAPYTLGFAFGVSEALNLVALGAYDHQHDGLEAAAEVALWIEGQPDAVVTALVPAGSDAVLENGVRYLPVVATSLTPGKVYIVGAYLDGGWATAFGLGPQGQQGQASVDARLQLLGDRFGDGFFAITYPGQSDGSAGAWPGANFQISAVPEPGGAVLLLAGLAGLAGRSRAPGAGPAGRGRRTPCFPG